LSSRHFETPPNVFNPSNRDEEVIDALSRAGYEPNACMQCGTCTASCLSGRWTAMRTRHIMVRASYGDASILQDPDIWLCTTCYNCYDRCPRSLKVTDAIVELRNLASARGLMSDKHKKTVELFHRYGHAVPINDKVKEIRKTLGLEELPPTIFRYPEEIEQLAKCTFKVGVLDEAKE
jgi:heterodisulfide reductase subunit C